MSEITPEHLRLFEAALLESDRAGALQILQGFEAPTLDSLADGLLVPVLERLGAAWEDGRIALSQIYMAGRICESLVGEHLDAVAPSSLVRPRVGVAAMCDHHALGKRLVQSVLRSAGYAPFDYGQGIEAEELAWRARADGVQALLVSTLMLRAALQVRTLVRLLAEDGGPRLPVIVGGAPFRLDPELWREVGADAMGVSAVDGPRLISKLLGGVA